MWFRTRNMLWFNQKATILWFNLCIWCFSDSGHPSSRWSCLNSQDKWIHHMLEILPLIRVVLKLLCQPSSEFAFRDWLKVLGFRSQLWLMNFRWILAKSPEPWCSEKHYLFLWSFHMRLRGGSIRIELDICLIVCSLDWRARKRVNLLSS